MHLRVSNNFLQRLITGGILGVGFWGLLVYLPPFYFSITLLIILALIIIFEWKRLFKITTPAFWLTMPLYPILPFALLIAMNQNPEYHKLLFILFILVFSFDTGSYIVGTLFGKHAISPTISAKKSWEGFLGGYCFALIGLWIILYEQSLHKPWYVLVPFTLIVCILSLLGDLFESWLKRRAHIKDSGTFLPGHGGFLDRFDGILFAVFFFYIFKKYLLASFF